MSKSLSAGRFAGGILLLALVVSLFQLEVRPERASFLIVKYGDEAATPEIAGGFLQQVGAFLEDSLPGTSWQGHIANTPQRAAQLLSEVRPSLVFIPPGFFLQHFSRSSTRTSTLVEVPRFGTASERYYVVAPKTLDVSGGWLRGKTVYSTFSVDEEYLIRVVFPPELRPGKDFRLEPAENLADEMFLLLEGHQDSSLPASAILLDEELKEFFVKDDLVWPELQVVWSSEELPRDIIVTVGDWDEATSEQLRDAFLKMQHDVKGREILDMLNSSGMKTPNSKLFERASKRYNSR